MVDIPSLIDKQDNFEIIRDQIAAILLSNTTNQQALAVTDGKDPALWAFDVYTERANPWEKYLNQTDNLDPIVNVWFESSSFIEGSSNIQERQLSETTYHIDMYGAGVGQDVAAGGHRVGDKEAALNCQRVARLVRNILMSPYNCYLGAQGLVWQRWPQAITSFQPTLDNVTHTAVTAIRFALRVRFNELSPEVEAETLDLLAFTLNRKEDGSVYFEADYDYT